MPADPIRGRWTLRERVMAFGGFQRTERGEFWISRDDVLRLLDECPDEQAIERAARRLAGAEWNRVGPVGRRGFIARARAVLSAALEQPE